MIKRFKETGSIKDRTIPERPVTLKKALNVVQHPLLKI